MIDIIWLDSNTEEYTLMYCYEIKLKDFDVSNLFAQKQKTPFIESNLKHINLG